ncbi:unnamed protein product, partial [Symbiodinium necroappetens]
ASKELTGDLTAMNWFLLILGVLPVWMVVVLARHLRRFPAGELCTCQKPTNSKITPGAVDEGIPVDFDSVLVDFTPKSSPKGANGWRNCLGAFFC